MKHLNLIIKVNLLSLEGKCPLCLENVMFRENLSWYCQNCKLGGNIKIESEVVDEYKKSEV